MPQRKLKRPKDSQTLIISSIISVGLLISLVLSGYYAFTLLFLNGLDNPNNKSTLLIALIFLAAFAIGSYLVGRGYIYPVVLIAVWGTFAAIIWIMQVLGLGFYSPIFYFIFVLIILCSYFLAGRQLILFTVAASLFIIFTFLQENFGWRQTEFPIPRIDFLIIILFSITFTAFGTYSTLWELSQRTEQLEQVQDHLEELVEERTKQLESALLKAEKANQAKSTFLATMSHELRTPLNAIIGYTEMLAEDLTEGVIHENSVSDTRRIHQSGKHLLNVINSILDLSKLEAGEESLQIESISPIRIIQEVVDSSKPLFTRSNNRVVVQLLVQTEGDTEQLAVAADRQKLTQILLNLVSNGNKFCQNGIIMLSVERSETGSDLIFSVQDTGIGLPDGDIERLFEPFQQLDSTYNRKYEGSGLGLAICKKFCELMDGHIHAFNHPEGGAVFQVTLPAAPVLIGGSVG